MQSPNNIASSLAHVEVRHSSVHGHGVFAARELPPGTLVGVYAGRRYAAHQACAMWDDGLTYLFGLSDGTLIDGAQGGNATRHLNHACEPNCEAIEEYAEDGQLIVRIEMIKAVRAGEELSLTTPWTSIRKTTRQTIRAAADWRAAGEHWLHVWGHEIPNPRAEAR